MRKLELECEIYRYKAKDIKVSKHVAAFIGHNFNNSLAVAFGNIAIALRDQPDCKELLMIQEELKFMSKCVKLLKERVEDETK